MKSSKQYAEKIVEVSYYRFHLVPSKETVIKATNALIDEYANQLVKHQEHYNELLVSELTQKQSEINELVKFIEKHAQKLGVVTQLKAVKLIQKHTKK